MASQADSANGAKHPAGPGLVGKLRLLWGLRQTWAAWRKYWASRTPEHKRRVIRSICGVIALGLAGYLSYENPSLLEALARVLDKALP